jgi:sortase (surface protein transpeptidase)
LSGSAVPGKIGNLVLAAHRDTCLRTFVRATKST